MIQLLFKRYVYAIVNEIENVYLPSALKPYYYKPTALDVDYNVHYTRNTFISTSRAISDYLLSLRSVI